MGFARLGLVVMAFLVLSCAKDRTPEDIKRDKWREDVARIQAAKGQYRGFLTGTAGRPIGAFQIELNPTIDVSPGSDGSSDNVRAILEVTLTLDIPREMTVGTVKAVFDPDSGTIKANLEDDNQPGAGTMTTSATRGAASSKVLASLFMSLDGGHLIGDLHLTGLGSAYDKHFDLLRDGKSLDALVTEGKITEPPSSSKTAIPLVGTTKFLAVDKVKPMQVIVTFPKPGSQRDFLNFLYPVKQVSLSFAYYEGKVAMLNPDVTWDTRTGELFGETVPTSVTPVLKFSCNSTGRDNLNQISCEHINTAVGNVAVTEAHLKTDKDVPMPDTSGTDKEQMRTYYGRARMGPSEVRAISMNVLYSARTPIADIDSLFFPSLVALQMTVDLNTPVISFPYSDTHWDRSTGSVHGEETYGKDVHRNLDCTGFQFMDQRAPFACTILIDRAAPIPMTFDRWR